MTQQDICQEYGSKWIVADLDSIVGVADNVDGNVLPINGLRHPPTSGTTGWYIWAGEVLSESDDFFKPVHLRHVVSIVPEIEKYLGLEAGWRFLIDPSKNFVDVWYDKSLLNLE